MVQKMAALLLMVILAIAFINRGQFSVGSTPSGASANVAYYGLVK